MIPRKDFSIYAPRIIEWIDEYFRQLESLPVKSQVHPKEIYNQLPATPPDVAEELDAILKDLTDIILPGITHWQHPNFHAYFPANSSVPSVYAEFITAALAAQCMIWDTSPAAAELEERVLEWLRDHMGLPSHFEGVIQDTASSATLVAILTAREVVTEFKANFEGVPPNLRVYASSEIHSSVDKAVGISGIGKNNLIKIPVDERLAMIPAALDQQLQKDKEDGYLPCCVVAAIGTTGTVAIDPIEQIAAICQKHGVWLHVDAAYAGSALLLPEYRWMAKGVELADSFVFNAHKWLFTNFDCSIYYVKNVEQLIRTFEVLPEYLKTSTRGLVNDYRDWGIALGRRFRALKLWVVIRTFGMDGLRATLRNHIALNQYFVEQIERTSGFEVLLPPMLNFCCIRYVPKGLQDLDQINQVNQQLLHSINQRGKLFVSHTKVNGQYVIRMVFGNTYLERRHVDLALEEIQAVAQELSGFD